MNKKIVLLILDGWGYREDTVHNATKLCEASNFDRLLSSNPHILLEASGVAVGLPEGQMGNSEVGHMNIGAGRVMYQDYLKINRSCEDGSILSNANIVDFFKNIRANNGRLHLFGLLSDGGVHSHVEHIKTIAGMGKTNGIEEVYVHAFTDGRDTPPNSGLDHVRKLDEHLRENDIGAVATVVGRYYAMDRDNRWDRVEKAYKMLASGDGKRVELAHHALEDGYKNGETDEFIMPSVVGSIDARVQDGDGVFFCNFRSDRAKELTKAFIAKDFDGFDRGDALNISFMSMTKYGDEFDIANAYPPTSYDNILGSILSKKGLKQLRIAETEKYAHVTYFFNCGIEDPFDGEDRVLIDSPSDVATYDKKPEMSVFEVTDRFESLYNASDIDFVVMNFANPDMVGHTGIEPAAILACKAVDRCLGRVVDICDKFGATLLVTADHGNSEEMFDEKNQQPHTAHTTNPVHFILRNYDVPLKDVRGKLADIAPTILDIIGIEKPKEMDGISLLAK